MRALCNVLQHSRYHWGMTANDSRSPNQREWLDMDAMVGSLSVAQTHELYTWRHQGKGPPSVRAGRRVLYRRGDVEKWLADQWSLKQHGERERMG